VTALKKTGHRLALAQAIADGAVRHMVAFGRQRACDEWDHGPTANLYSGHSRRYQRVTARMRELHDYELVKLSPETERWSRLYQLTPAGEALLREWGGTP
jgi:hypothetical protein